MSQRSNCWPKPHDPEHLFAKALLLHGPLPPKGWRVTRAASGRASYIVAGSRECGRFTEAVVTMFAQEIAQRYAIRKWSVAHCRKVGQMWKNLFMLWVWECKDEHTD